jgi:hypothetical protein
MKMQVTVYFIHEPTGYMMPVAMFSNEELYMDCLSALTKSAEASGYVVGETVHCDDEEGETK